MLQAYFLDVIQQLRQQENLILYGNMLVIGQVERIETVAFLHNEYEQESMEYPYAVPLFDEAAALWGATTLYTAAQLILYRENKDAELPELLPDFDGERTPSAILSADLCLRFLPDLLKQLILIDSEDPLVPILHALIERWHYSGIAHLDRGAELAFETITTNPCLHQLYVNRVIAYQKMHLARLPECRDRVAASLGMYADTFWKDFTVEQYIDEKH